MSKSKKSKNHRKHTQKSKRTHAKNSLLSNKPEVLSSDYFNKITTYTIHDDYKTKHRDNVIFHKDDKHQINVYYISDIHLEHHIDNIVNPNFEILQIVKNIFGSNEYTSGIVFILGDICDDISILKIFLTTMYIEYHDIINQIFIVPGNHEFNTLNFNYMECYNWYENFLYQYDGFYKLLWCDKLYYNNSEDIWVKYYENEYTQIFGTIGSQVNNPVHNSSNTIGCFKSLEDEAEIGIKQEMCFKHFFDSSDNSKVSIFVSHYPVYDFIKSSDIVDTNNDNIVFICGHDHKNEHLYYSKMPIFKDGQIGYKKAAKILFKKLIINKSHNIYIDLNDGIHNSSYIEYWTHLVYYTNGVIIPVLSEEKNKQLIRLCYKGYSAYFIRESDMQFKLIHGRRTKNIYVSDINALYNQFVLIVNKVNQYYTPIVSFLEEQSEKVKKIGYEGRLHGLIIDIDFYNHMMFDPFIGTFIYYYSPSYGIVRVYSSLEELLSAKREISDKSNLQKVDINTSLYKISNEFKKVTDTLQSKIFLIHSDMKIYKNVHDIFKGIEGIDGGEY